ncbi:cytochrome P450 [Rickenella mellea]|uniref:Cytochrome P450 n=1 Tax=Rickenella mellea TaxID=50990 RepID=A0A4R5XG78_9AGAM|nr:cytochrome P450 [Rickenella mellea]
MDAAYIRSWLAPHSYNYSVLLSLAAVFILVYFIILATYRLYFSPLRSIPGPWYAAVSDFWLTTHVLRLRRCRAIDDLFKRYGPIVRVGPNKVMFVDASAMRSVYGATNKFSKSTWYKALLTNENDHAMTRLEHSVHATIRRGYAPHYTSSNLALFQSEMHQFTLQLINTLTTLSIQTPSSYDTLLLFRLLMVDVNSAHLFGYNPGALTKWANDESHATDALSMTINDFPKRGLVRSALPEWLWNILTLVPNARWRKLCNSDKILAEYVSDRLYETRENLQAGKIDIDNMDKIPLFVRLAHHRYSTTNEAMPDKDIVSEGMGHMIAGSDTTSTTLSYIFWELSRRPDIVSKLRKELDQCMPDPHQIPDIQILQAKPYLGALIKEVLRVYGAAPSPLERVVSATGPSSSATPFSLIGHILPPGTIVATQAWSLHRQSTVFPSPDVFNPDRWLSNSIADNTPSSQITSIPSFDPDSSLSSSAMNSHMMPFGSGTRTCGGQNVAQMMLRIVVAAMVRNFDVIASSETTEKSMEIKDSFVIFPAGMECKLAFIPRTH